MLLSAADKKLSVPVISGCKSDAWKHLSDDVRHSQLVVLLASISRNNKQSTISINYSGVTVNDVRLQWL
jgi:hypothetical protein